MKIGIYGYGNLGRGVESGIAHSSDMELTAVFTRRAPDSLRLQTPHVPVIPAADVEQYAAAVDVLVVCGGSATDLPTQTPALVKRFNVVDSFDTHARIPDHFEAVNAAALQGGQTALISAGWDPGLFSLNRVYAQSVLPCGVGYTFWGKGVSQGHSDAIRRIDGVKDAKQYTVPIEKAMEAVRCGETPELTPRQKHTRECFVVAEPGADKARITREIQTMPNYFADYDTTVHFVDEATFLREHAGIPHGGTVLHSGKTGWQNEHKAVIEYRLTLDSNPEFTAGVLLAYARAVYRLHNEQRNGCFTVLDVPPAYLSPLSADELRRTCL